MRRPGRRGAKKRMLLIVNPYATTVSDRLKNLVVYALQGRYEVETVATEAQNHATEIGREVRDHGYDIVVAFGGDGTLNEVANGLAGTDVPVSVLPGGSTNVVCRTLGIPNDVVDATEHLLALVDEWAPRRIDRRSSRLTPTMLAVIAAMIRIASRPSRKTINAELVITVVALSPSPVFALASSSASSSSRRVVLSSRTPASSAIWEASPSKPRAPYHVNPSISVVKPGSKAFSLISGPNSKNA